MGGAFEGGEGEVCVGLEVGEVFGYWVGIGYVRTMSVCVCGGASRLC